MTERRLRLPRLLFAVGTHLLLLTSCAGSTGGNGPGVDVEYPKAWGQLLTDWHASERPATADMLDRLATAEVWELEDATVVCDELVGDLREGEHAAACSRAEEGVVFIDRDPSAGQLAHELAHLLSWLVYGDSDRHHCRPHWAMWECTEEQWGGVLPRGPVLVREQEGRTVVCSDDCVVQVELD